MYTPEELTRKVSIIEDVLCGFFCPVEQDKKKKHKRKLKKAALKAKKHNKRKDRAELFRPKHCVKPRVLDSLEELF